MANISEISNWEGVYQLETTDYATGGVGGTMNRQALSLANRTLYLKTVTEASGIPNAVNYSGNLNSIFKSGFFYASSSANGLPVSGVSGYLSVIALDGSSAAQTFITSNDDRMFIRRSSSGNWQAWREVQTNSQLVGLVVPFGNSTAPNGWLKCNGAAVSRTAYAFLFAAIGTTFGIGDGSTTFNLPDLRGEFIRGWDDGRGIDVLRSLGSWQADMFKSHDHTVNTGDVAGRSDNASDKDVMVPGFRTVVTSSAGGAETRPRNISLNFCIKY